MQGKRRAFESFQVVALVKYKTSWQYFFPIYRDSCGQSWLSVLGSRVALAAVPQAASTVLCAYSLPGVSSLCAERKVLYLLKGAARISRQISEKCHGTVITVTGERTGYPVMVT